MGAIEVGLLLLAWVAIFSLLVVVPWAVVRVVVALLEADPGAALDRWTPSVPESEGAQEDSSTTGMPSEGPQSQSVRSDRAMDDR